MKHNVSGYKLKRDVGARNSLLKGLVTSVIEHERVITTVPKAKAVKPLVDRMITLAKRDSLHTRRQAAAFLETPAAVKKLFDKLGTRFGQRQGGYTRIVKLGPRSGDNAEMAIIGRRAYVVAEVNDVRPGEAAGWPEIYSAMAIVDLERLAVERFVPFARGGQRFDNVTLPVGSCFVPRIGTPWMRTPFRRASPLSMPTT